MSSEKTWDSSKMILRALLAFSVAFLAGAVCAGNFGELIPGFVRINTRPSQFTMDYFVLGGLGSAFLNTGLIGLICCGVLYFSKAKCTGLTVAAFWLNVGYGTFGMNCVNIWPFIFGVWVYSRIKKVSFGSVANLSLFATALAPFASEFIFRYPNLEATGFSFVGFLIAIVFGVVVGLVMPALCAHAPNFHKGYDLYNAGPAAGFLAFFMFCVFFKSAGVEVPTNTNLGDGERLFVSAFFGIVFVLFIAAAYLMDKNCFKDYKKLWKSDSYKTDYAEFFGIPATFVNIGLYGLFLLLYFNVVHGMTMADGSVTFSAAKFTGATMGALMCMMSFCAQGAQPRTVFPILVGYAAASLLPFAMFASGIAPAQSWTLTTQGILVGVAFASGLAPVSGRFGFFAGVAAGAIHAILVTSVPLIHGGFLLYNGGFTAGIVAFLLIPVLECFRKPKEEKK